MYFYTAVIVQGPVNTTVCQGDNATFTCVVFTPSNRAIIAPGWLRNSTNFDVRDVENNRTGDDTPVYISYTITVVDVTLSDDGLLYQCDLLEPSENAKLNVVGKYVNCDIRHIGLVSMICMCVHMYVRSSTIAVYNYVVE